MTVLEVLDINDKLKTIDRISHDIEYREEFEEVTGNKDISDDDYAALETLLKRLNALPIEGLKDKVYDKARGILNDTTPKEVFMMYKNRDFDTLLRWAVCLAYVKDTAEDVGTVRGNEGSELARMVICGTANVDEAQNTAYNILGAAEAIREKIDGGITLSQADLNYISEHLD